MSVAYNAPDWLLRNLGSQFVLSNYKLLERHLRMVTPLTDDALRQVCRRALEGDDLRELFGKSRSVSPLRRLVRTYAAMAELALPYVALGVEAFRRHPADLPDGAQLYPEQVRAAIALVQPSALQMDTGEGKTYAALPAAFALACQHGRVYVVCANRYLAWRDATRTSRFWDAAGASVAHAYFDSPAHAWNRRVVYTTITDVVFHDLQNEVRKTKPDAPLMTGAVVLDEIDAILLDDTEQPFSLVRSLTDVPFEWSWAIQYAQQLTPEDIQVDAVNMTATLTVAGETRLRESWGIQATSSSRYLLGRYAVELAYVAQRVAERDRDYIVSSGQVIPVNRRTGQLESAIRPDWVLPLEFGLGLQRRFRNVIITQTTPTRLLRRFAHVSGMSGSARDDFLDYLMLHWLMPVTIEPRHPRQDGWRRDQVYRTREEAYRCAIRVTLEAVDSKRPVLIGAQSIEDAEAIHRRLERQLPAGTVLHLLTGKNERDIAAVLEHAGEVGSVVVATQLVGRGVDIRLSADARANGGLYLIGFSHSRELRHDRQFMGRAGRQGDPFTALFICSLEDDMLTSVGANRIQHFMERLGLDEDVPIEHPMVDQAIRRAQRAVRVQAFLNRQAAAIHGHTIGFAHDEARQWFEFLQAESEAYPDECGPEFLRWVVDQYIDRRILPMWSHASHLGRSDSERVVATIHADLRVAAGKLPLTPLDIEGRARDVVRERIRRALLDVLRKAAAQNARARVAALCGIRRRQIVHALMEMADALAHAGLPAGVAIAGAGPGGGAMMAVADAADSHADPRHNYSLLARSIVTQAGAAGIARLLEEIRTVAQSLDADESNGVPAAIQARQRTPRSIAAESLILTWSGFLEHERRQAFRVAQFGFKPLDHYRRLSHDTETEWKRVREQFAQDAIANLIAGADPASLDELFFTEEHQQYVAELHDMHAFQPPPSPAPAPEATRVEDRGKQLAAEYLAKPSSSFGLDEATVAELRRIVLDFAERFPPSHLQAPTRVLDALEQWSRLEMERGVSALRRRTHRKWIGNYLRFLRGRHAIGPLPTLGQRARWRLNAVVEVATAQTSIIALATITAFVAFFAAASWIGRLPGMTLQGEWVAVDLMLCGGLLSAGVITAAAFPGLLLGRGLTLLLFPHATVRGNTIEKLAVFGVQIALAAWIALPHALDYPAVLAALSAFVACLIVARITDGVTWFVEPKSGVALDNLWLSGSLLFVFAPWAVSTASAPYTSAAVLLAAVAAAAFGPRINGATLRLASDRIYVSGSVVQTEEVVTPSTISGSSGFAAVLFALLFAKAVDMPDSASTVARAMWLPVYMAVIAALTWFVINTRTNVARWRQMLNVTRRIIAGVDDGDALPPLLQRLRRRLFVREVLLQAILLGAGVAAIGWDTRLARIPAVPLLLVAGYLLVEAARPSLVSLRALVTGIRTFPAHELDFAAAPDPDENATVWQRIQNLKSGRVYAALGLLLLVLKAAEIVLQPITAKLFRNVFDLVVDVVG